MECGGTAPLPRDKAQRGLEKLQTEKGRGLRVGYGVEKDRGKVWRILRAGRTAGVMIVQETWCSCRGVER